jgi:hypothetical protein
MLFPQINFSMQFVLSTVLLCNGHGKLKKASTRGCSLHKCMPEDLGNKHRAEMPNFCILDVRYIQYNIVVVINNLDKSRFRKEILRRRWRWTKAEVEQGDKKIDSEKNKINSQIYVAKLSITLGRIVSQIHPKMGNNSGWPWVPKIH